MSYVVPGDKVIPIVRGCVKNKVYGPPLSDNILKPKEGIHQVSDVSDTDILSETWDQFTYHLEEITVTHGAHIEQSQADKNTLFELMFSIL
jgi:hypothetical protein